MIIKRIEVENFWGKYYIKWDLDNSVNILTGINGAGKSTLFDLISSIIIGGKTPKFLVTKSSRVKIEFDDGSTLVNINFNDSYLALQRQAKDNEVLNELKEDIDSDFNSTSRKTRLNSIMLNASISFVENKDKEKIPISRFLNQLNVDIISTFDEPLTIIEEKSKWESLKEDGVRSSLDNELHNLQEQYSFYIGDLASRIEQIIMSGNNPSIESLTKLYATKNLFIETINELFKSTGKVIDINNSKLSFKIVEDNIPISIYELSSGEKQMLYILWKVLIQDQKPYIIFLDEPEISLHVDWQEVLISKIKLLNPNCQIVLATHAPTVVLDGWQPFVQYLDDLKVLVDNNGK